MTKQNRRPGDDGTAAKVHGDATSAGKSTAGIRPYAEGAKSYRARGLGQAVPVEPAEAKPLLTGVIGSGAARDGDTPRDEEKAWRKKYADAALGLHLAADVVALDVDDPDALQRALGTAGLDLPVTAYSTARGAGSPRRHLFYRVDESTWRSNGLLPAGGEVVDADHRFALVWPSVHRKTGEPYRWFFPTTEDAFGSGRELESPPLAAELAELPAEIAAWICAGASARGEAVGACDAAALEEWMDAERKPEPGKRVRAAVEAVPRDGASEPDLLGLMLPVVRAAHDARSGRRWAVEHAIEQYSSGYGRDAEKAADRAVRRALEIVCNDSAGVVTLPLDEPIVKSGKKKRKRKRVDGARVLDDVRSHLERFIAYPNDWAASAHALWIAHAHVVEAFENTPRIAFLSPEPGSGKSRAIELTEALVPNPLLSVNASVSAIFRSIDDDDPPTLLLDEVDAIFSGKTSESEDLRGLLNSGYRRGAFALRSAVRGKEVVVEEWPTFCATALAGLNRLPDTLMTRAVVVRMKRRRRDQHVEPYRRRVNGAEGTELRGRLASWTSAIASDLLGVWPELPEGVADRDADVWEPLLAIADAAGGHWAVTARDACVEAVTEAASRPLSLGVQLLLDIRTLFRDRDRIASAQLLGELHAMETAPWGSIKGEPIDSRFLARMLADYEIEPRQMRIDGLKTRGYARGDFLDAWERYVVPAPRPLPADIALIEEKAS